MKNFFEAPRAESPRILRFYYQQSFGRKLKSRRRVEVSTRRWIKYIPPIIEAPRAKARGFFGPNSFNPSDLSTVALAKAEAENLGIHSRLESRSFLRRWNKKAF